VITSPDGDIAPRTDRDGDGQLVYTATAATSPPSPGYAMATFRAIPDHMLAFAAGTAATTRPLRPPSTLYGPCPSRPANCDLCFSQLISRVPAFYALHCLVKFPTLRSVGFWSPSFFPQAHPGVSLGQPCPRLLAVLALIEVDWRSWRLYAAS